VPKLSTASVIRRSVGLLRCRSSLCWHHRSAVLLPPGKFPLGRADEGFDGDFIDEQADERQREALQLIFGRRVGGWPAMMATFIATCVGWSLLASISTSTMTLAAWRAEIPGKLTSNAETLGGPTTPPGKRVQVHNAAVPNRSGWHGDLRESHCGQG
jgi:hypothetical protein